jgi:hypothetical protein
MENINNNGNRILFPNPITQVAGMPYALYLSLQGKYFLGSTEELLFGNGKSAWAALYNPASSGVNLYVYFWQVANTGQSPIRAQIWFNSSPSGNPVRITTITPGNTALYPTPRTKIRMYQATDVTEEPEGGVKAFVRRAQAGTTVGDEEFGKFIFPPGGSFLIYLSDPETPDKPARATVGLAWWEDQASCE